MLVVSAMNAFKGALGSIGASECVAKGLQDSQVETLVFPLADGGDGTLEVFRYLMMGDLVAVHVHDPFGRIIEANYLRMGDTAIMESAKASGLALLKGERLDPLKASSFGTGELMSDAIEKGASRIILGIGGSATNDGGLGLLIGLGAKAKGTTERGGRGLLQIEDIDISVPLEKLEGRSLVIAADVLNPLTGPKGATMVYGPQKGVTSDLAIQFEPAMSRWRNLLEQKTAEAIGDRQGSGAAGGMGAAAIAIGGQVRLGAEIVLELARFDEKASRADGLVTGEGRLDGQTSFGKAPLVVAKAFKGIGGRRVIGLAGELGNGYEMLRPPFDAFFSIAQGPISLEESMASTAVLLQKAAIEIGRIIS